MSKRLEATYDGESWKENVVETGSTVLKISTVISERNFKGAMQGHGMAVYTLVYHPAPPDAEGNAHARSASYTGAMYFSGTIPSISDKPGELVFLTTGAHKPVVPGVESDDVGAKAEWVVDEKSGTGGLKGVKGKGGYHAKAMAAIPVWLELSV